MTTKKLNVKAKKIPVVAKTTGKTIDTKKVEKIDLEYYKKFYDVKEASPRLILEKQLELLEGYAKICLQVIQPEEYYALIECNNFSEHDKTEIMRLYRQVMIAHRSGLIAIVDHADQEIPAIQKNIEAFRPEIVEVIKKFRDAWKKETPNGRAGYFG